MPFRNEIAREGILVETSSLENACGGTTMKYRTMTDGNENLLYNNWLFYSFNGKNRLLNCLIEKKKKENISTLSTLSGLIHRK